MLRVLLNFRYISPKVLKSAKKKNVLRTSVIGRKIRLYSQEDLGLNLTSLDYWSCKCEQVT